MLETSFGLIMYLIGGREWWPWEPSHRAHSLMIVLH